jgi:hypothetical protein
VRAFVLAIVVVVVVVEDAVDGDVAVVIVVAVVVDDAAAGVEANKVAVDCVVVLGVLVALGGVPSCGACCSEPPSDMAWRLSSCLGDDLPTPWPVVAFESDRSWTWTFGCGRGLASAADLPLGSYDANNSFDLYIWLEWLAFVCEAAPALCAAWLPATTSTPAHRADATISIITLDIELVSSGRRRLTRPTRLGWLSFNLKWQPPAEAIGRGAHLLSQLGACRWARAAGPTWRRPTKVLIIFRCAACNTPHSPS